MVKMKRAACVLVGAAGMYFLDPSLGKRRRAMARDKIRSRIAHATAPQESASGIRTGPAPRRDVRPCRRW